jgi:hypothetical protein
VRRRIVRRSSPAGGTEAPLHQHGGKDGRDDLPDAVPPHFNVGVSLEPVYPSSYTRSYFEYGVDGPSVQSTPSQDELEPAHYLSSRDGPKGGGEPWVISGDTGIHPTAAGYGQMESQVPPPAPQG